jgi:GntR family transcriptional regulator
MSLMLNFYLDASSGVATYLQIVQQVRQSIQLGILRPGDRLPTAQQVVVALAINPNTVLKAYRELEREGLVYAKQGQGTFVSDRAQRSDTATQTRFLATLTTWIQKAHAAGLDDDDIEAIFRIAVRNEAAEEVV